MLGSYSCRFTESSKETVFPHCDSFSFLFLICSRIRMEEKFYDAVGAGQVEEVKEILRNNPNLNVNWVDTRDYNKPTALCCAARLGHDSIVSTLLAHPDINVNLKNKHGYTPFTIACCNGHPCVRLLLKDPRVLVNEPGNSGDTPLYWAVSGGHVDVIKWWIASGREMNLGKPGGDYLQDALWAAREEERTEVAALLERFQENPEETRSEVRVEITW